MTALKVYALVMPIGHQGRQILGVFWAPDLAHAWAAQQGIEIGSDPDRHAVVEEHAVEIPPGVTVRIEVR